MPFLIISQSEKFYLLTGVRWRKTYIFVGIFIRYSATKKFVIACEYVPLGRASNQNPLCACNFVKTNKK